MYDHFPVFQFAPFVCENKLKEPLTFMYRKLDHIAINNIKNVLLEGLLLETICSYSERDK